MNRRTEVLVTLGALAVSTVLLSSLWAYLTDLTLHHRPGVGKAPYNTMAPDKALPW